MVTLPPRANVIIPACKAATQIEESSVYLVPHTWALPVNGSNPIEPFAGQLSVNLSPFRPRHPCAVLAHASVPLSETSLDVVVR